ncbi:hypothetical protein GOP47_0024104 [Adiantum capillus-veneris]|nr:hypothetical protein GOP47_0024104 [Adiantum capillus-veneris]
MAIMGPRSLSYSCTPESSLRNASASLCTTSSKVIHSRNSKDGFIGSFCQLRGSFSLKSLELRTPQKWSSRIFRLNVKADSDFYNMLGVSRNSSKAEIKTSYRKLARQYHPDVNKDPGAEAKFKDISNAYEVLSDDDKRSIYDTYGEAGLKGVGAGGDSMYGSPFDLFEAFFESMGDMDGIGGMGGLGGMGSSRKRRAHGPDEQHELQIEFLEAIFGVNKDIVVSRLDLCNTCDGSGNKPGTKPKKCNRCGGKGQIVSSTRTPFGDFRQIFPCNTCGGVGQSTTPCNLCKGEGRARKKKTVKVQVPAGVESGNRLRVRAEGSVGKRGGPPGDLMVSLYVRPDPQLSRDGSNILYTCKISYIDAIKGTCVKVPTVDGNSDLRIPAGTQPGTTLVMARKGAPVLGQPNIRGDQLVRIQVDIPRHLSSQERELIEQLSELSHAQPVNVR